MMRCTNLSDKAGAAMVVQEEGQERPIFYVSDGTGITAETIGHSVLT